MSDWVFVLIMLLLLLAGLSSLVAFTLSFVRGYQISYRARSIGEPNAFPWPPLPKRLRSDAPSTGDERK